MANTARVTQSALELVTTGAAAEARITQNAIEFVTGVGVVCGNPPAAQVGQAYTHTFPSGGGTPPYTFSITAGALPPGLNLNTSTGTVTGSPNQAGVFVFTITVLDSYGTTSSATCSITVSGTGGAGGGVPVVGCGCCPPLPKWPRRRRKRSTEFPCAPEGSSHRNVPGTAVGPLTTVPVVICQYQVPDNCRAQLVGLVAAAQAISGWVPGNGDVIFSVTIQRTPGGTEAQGIAFPDLQAITIPLGSIRQPWPIPDAERNVLEGRWIIRLMVQTNPVNITPGDATRFTGVLHLWEWGIA